ncbi:hypothetical protein IH824_19130 [candidate division KSB1 bacterium]|nr:hypothetical protein [candidate division KSB1 bacterium]
MRKLFSEYLRLAIRGVGAFARTSAAMYYSVHVSEGAIASGGRQLLFSRINYLPPRYREGLFKIQPLAAGSVTEPAAAIFSPTLYCFHLFSKIPKRLIQFHIFVDALYFPGGDTM